MYGADFQRAIDSALNEAKILQRNLRQAYDVVDMRAICDTHVTIGQHLREALEYASALALAERLDPECR